MYVYRCLRRFFCTPLERYIPVGAHVARYENAVRVVLDEAPQSDQDPFNVLVDGIEYAAPEEVTWLYGMEPAPLGSVSGWFTVIATKEEDAYGNVSSDGGGLPPNSELKVGETTGKVYLKSQTNGLFYQLRMSGGDGSASIQVGQTGIPGGNVT